MAGVQSEERPASVHQAIVEINITRMGSFTSHPTDVAAS